MQVPASEDLSATPWRSFWQAGFEGADHRNGSGQPLDLIAATRHVERAAEDYARLAEFGIRTVRESVGWRRSSHGRGYDFDHLRQRARAARRRAVQVQWTLMHYGVPDGLGFMDPDFIPRFQHFCEAVARCLAPMFEDDAPPVFTPVNEISFLAWAACNTGLIHPWKGDCPERAGELKRQLVRAAIAGADALRQVIPGARMLHVDPLVHIVAPEGRPDLAEAAAREREFQFEALDMLLGRRAPELGGSESAVDRIGINWYRNNQWEAGTLERLHWHLADPRRMPLSDLLAEVHQRYGRPLTLAETSHEGPSRSRWIQHVAAEVGVARGRGVEVDGICLYPALDRPDWEEPSRWHQSGLWTVTADDPGTRQLDLAYAHGLRAAQRHLEGEAPASSTAGAPALVVFSHLRWDFVWQRPQHLLTRLACGRRVIVVEEPMHAKVARPVAEVLDPMLNVQILRVHTALDEPGFSDAQMKAIAPLLDAHLEAEGIRDYSAWFYTPMALPLLDGLSPRAVIYDCMDELSAFAKAPPQLLEREAALLGRAHVVFTGGPSLYEAKRGRHANVHCLPSSVDLAHFAQGADPALTHPEMRSLRHPRLGFFGVIDERLDTGLVGELAAAHPEWEICMVGPVVKIDPASLPQAPNLHWFGQRSYAELPRFLAGWNVALLPFAMNEATRFISPTKTLEYMAAGKPVVSTPVHDVARLYGGAVRIAEGAGDFIAACEAAMAETGSVRLAREKAMCRLVTATSWDQTAATMRARIEALEQGVRPMKRAAAPRSAADAEVLPLASAQRAAATTARKRCVVIGAGPTGLAAAMHLGADACLVEQGSRVGGWCRSIEDRGFTFDYAGHIMFSRDPYVLELYETLLGDNLHWQDREAWIYSKGVHTRYPFQGALYGLPPEVLKECLVGAIEARFGALAGTAPEPAGRGRAPDDCCADGTALEDGRAGHCAPASRAGARSEPENFEQFIYQVWGAGVAKHFAIPYNRKLWAVPLSEMETSWLGGRVPLPDLEAMIEGALQPVGKPMGPNARFGYPLRGGFQALMDGFLPHLQGELLLESRVVKVLPTARQVVLADGRRLAYEQLVSTMPLPKLVEAIGDAAPVEVRKAAQGLRHVSVRCVNLGIGREKLTGKHWIYYPEETVFHRVFVQGNASPHCNPPGGFGLTCEITYSPDKPLPCDGGELVQRCIAECIEVGLFTADDPVLTANLVDMPYAYVVYDHARAGHVALIREWLLGHDIHLAGRYSEWEYYNSDHAFVAGKRVAGEVAEALQRTAAPADAVAPAAAASRPAPRARIA